MRFCDILIIGRVCVLENMCGNLSAYILTEKKSVRVSSFHFIVGRLCAANFEMAASAQSFSDGGKRH